MVLRAGRPEVHLRTRFFQACLMPLRCWELSGTAKAPWAPVGSSQIKMLSRASGSLSNAPLWSGSIRDGLRIALGSVSEERRSGRVSVSRKVISRLREEGVRL